MSTTEFLHLGGESRRSFIKKTAGLTAAAAAGGLWPAYGAPGGSPVFIVADPDDPLTQRAPVRWAIQQLNEALQARGFAPSLAQNLTAVTAGQECILVGSGQSKLAQQTLADAKLALSESPESLALARGKAAGKQVLLAAGADERGMIYSVLELADRVRLANDAAAELKIVPNVSQKPANKIRSVSRLFASDVEDKAWYNDRGFWERYLTELATQRFNRFNLALGLGYDFATGLLDTYFYFAYPFFLNVPGYNVKAKPLPDEERDRNLAMLQFISAEAARRGLHFQIGIWTHAFEWANSPHVNYTIEGLTRQTQAPYCRAALTALLKACPAINGVTLRIHGESGVTEGSYDFWKEVFAGAKDCGRRVELDLHAKGIDDKMINLALATGLPVTVAPKYWAEHMGLGYMQGAIRPDEMPRADAPATGLLALSSGSRSFLRYGFGDLLTEKREYSVMHRIWPGSQRLLLWGDPEMAADYARVSSFCGSAGVEYMEPLSFKGRKGSGLPGGRNAYADQTLTPKGGDYEKYLYSYRVWGRKFYDPQCDPDEWRRLLRKQFDAGADAMESALAQASRILPLITTAHCPSAANNNYWPEIYTNMPIVDARRPHPYSDTASPKRFGTVSPLDPAFFSRVEDYAAECVEGKPGAKYSPAWVAARLESDADGAAMALAAAESQVRDPAGVEFRRAAADIAIQGGVGRFFAWKFRAAVLYAIYDRTGYKPALEQALKAYKQARENWASMAEAAKPIYRGDITVGTGAFQRGHWLDRLPAIDADISDMEKKMETASTPKPHAPAVNAAALEEAIVAVLQMPVDPKHPALPNFHQPARSFKRGGAVVIEASLKDSVVKLDSLRLHYRVLNQGVVWQSMELTAANGVYRGEIPAPYTDSPFPLQYHFELREASSAVWLYPGLLSKWEGQPYYVIHQA